MTTHKGDLAITDPNADYSDLTRVTGSLTIRADAHLPALESVGWSLFIEADAQLPVLESVGGNLIIRADAQLPVLESVGWNLFIRADVQLPVLTHADSEKGARLFRTGALHAPRLASRVFHEIESDDHYTLCRSDDGYYVSGCRGPWSAEQALAHWRDPRPDNKRRAALFVLAIERAEGMAEQEKQA